MPTDTDADIANWAAWLAITGTGLACRVRHQSLFSVLYCWQHCRGPGIAKPVHEGFGTPRFIGRTFSIESMYSPQGGSYDSGY